MKLYIPCGNKPVPKTIPGNWISCDGWMDRRRKARISAVCDMRRLPFRDSVFDEIYCSHGIEHIPKPEHVPTLREFRRCLRRGGKLRLSVPHLAAIVHTLNIGCPLKWAYDHLWGDQTDPGRFHYACFTGEIMERLLCKAGFRKVKSWDARIDPPPVSDDALWSRTVRNKQKTGATTVWLSLNMEAMR